MENRGMSRPQHWFASTPLHDRRTVIFLLALPYLAGPDRTGPMQTIRYDTIPYSTTPYTVPCPALLYPTIPRHTIPVPCTTPHLTIPNHTNIPAKHATPYHTLPYPTLPYPTLQPIECTFRTSTTRPRRIRTIWTRPKGSMTPSSPPGRRTTAKRGMSGRSCPPCTW